MKIPKEQLLNRSYYSNALMWNPQLPGRSNYGNHYDNPNDIPAGLELQEDGSVICRMYAPTAKSVTVGQVLNERVALTKGEDGVWTGVIKFPLPGMKGVTWEIDGVDAVNPYATIGFGWGRICNYIDVPCPEQDYLMIRDVPHGTITREWYFSTTTNAWESCIIYLPPQYMAEPERRFPILYLQHGGSQNETSWVYEAKLNFTMDNLIADGKAVPFVVVMNNGMVQVQNDKGEWYVESDAFSDLLLKDCMPFIEKKYRVLTDRWNRAVGGLSMGSGQASALFMAHPELFATAGLFTGFRAGGRGSTIGYDLTQLVSVEEFNARTRLFYFGAGLDEPSNENVRAADAFFNEKGVKHVAGLFPGEHEWHAWRALFHDFAQRAFQD